MWSGWVTRADLLPSVRYMLYWIIQLKYDSQTLMKAFKINRFYFRKLQKKSHEEEWPHKNIFVPVSVHLSHESERWLVLSPGQDSYVPVVLPDQTSLCHLSNSREPRDNKTESLQHFSEEARYFGWWSGTTALPERSLICQLGTRNQTVTMRW